MQGKRTEGIEARKTITIMTEYDQGIWQRVKNCPLTGLAFLFLLESPGTLCGSLLPLQLLSPSSLYCVSAGHVAESVPSSIVMVTTEGERGRTE